MTEMRTSLRRVRGLGSAHEGTGHFWQQRLSAISNLVLITGFVILLIVLLVPQLNQLFFGAVFWLVAALPAAAQIVVIHRRQVVVNQRIDMDAFDGEPDAQRRFARNVEQIACRLHQQRAQSLAPADRRMTHRVIQPRARIVGHGQQPVEAQTYMRRNIARPRQHVRDRAPAFGHQSQSAPNGWAPVTAPLASTVSLAMRASAACNRSAQRLRKPNAVRSGRASSRTEKEEETG